VFVEDAHLKFGWKPSVLHQPPYLLPQNKLVRNQIELEGSFALKICRPWSGTKPISPAQAPKLFKSSQQRYQRTAVESICRLTLQLFLSFLLRPSSRSSLTRAKLGLVISISAAWHLWMFMALIADGNVALIVAESSRRTAVFATAGLVF
jgi:hypothetical protein